MKPYDTIKRYTAFSLLLMLAGCTSFFTTAIPVDRTSVLPGGTVISRGAPQRLIGTPLAVGQALPSSYLLSDASLTTTDLNVFKGKVVLISIVPSIDTTVCEAQTHYLGEQGRRLPNDIVRLTISRDTPFAQKRFAHEARLDDITFLSDYRDASFGRSTGLLLEESLLLARAVAVVDRKGIVRYLQVVPDMGHLPDMEAAFRVAENVLKLE